MAVNHSGSGGVGVLLTASCSLWASTRCRPAFAFAIISELLQADGQPKMFGSDCISSATSSSSRNAASSASVGSKTSSNPEAGTMRAAPLL